MAKVIKFTEELRKAVLEDFIKALDKGKCQNGEFSYTRRIPGADGRKAKILLEPKAWEKMYMLIDHFSTEVSWHGICRRGDEPDTYLVSDILVFPQRVTDATADTDQEKYAAWLLSLPREVKRQIRFHGHSHVTMPAFASGTDLGYQREILGDLSDEDFYVFMIWNKKLEFWATVFDMKTNVQFEDADISCILQGSDWDPRGFLEETDRLVTTAPAASKWTGSSYDPAVSYYNGGATAVSKTGGKKKKKGSKIPIPVSGSADDEDDEFDDDLPLRSGCGVFQYYDTGID